MSKSPLTKVLLDKTFMWCIMLCSLQVAFLAAVAMNQNLNPSRVAFPPAFTTGQVFPF